MKRVVFEVGYNVLGSPTEKELSSGLYYELPDELVHRFEDALYDLEDLEIEVMNYTLTHPMAGEEPAPEPAPTTPILPPGVDK